MASETVTDFKCPVSCTWRHCARSNKAARALSSSQSAGESSWSPLHTASRKRGMTLVPIRPRAHSKTCSKRPRKEARSVATLRPASAVRRRSWSSFASRAAFRRMQTSKLLKKTSAPRYPGFEEGGLSLGVSNMYPKIFTSSLKAHVADPLVRAIWRIPKSS